MTLRKGLVLDMEKIAGKLTDLIGNTPLLELRNYEKAEGLEARVVAKLEAFNPLSSVKDRVGFAIIEDGETAHVNRAAGRMTWSRFSRMRHYRTTIVN